MPKTTAKPKEPATIEFEPIPCVDDKGHIALKIHPPGTFFGGKMFSVHIDGCGVGSASKRDAAKRVLLAQAVESMNCRIAEAQRTGDHYQTQRNKLLSEGLRPVKVKK